MTQEKFEVIIEQNTVSTFLIKANSSEEARQIAVAGTHAPHDTRKGLKHVAQIAIVPPRFKIEEDRKFTKRFAVTDSASNDDAIAEFLLNEHAQILCDALNEREDAE